MERIEGLGLRKSNFIKDTIIELQKNLHLTNTQMKNMFPDLMRALKQETFDNIKRSILMVRVKTTKRFKY